MFVDVTIKKFYTMKKKIAIFLGLSLLVLTAGCGQQKNIPATVAKIDSEPGYPVTLSILNDKGEPEVQTFTHRPRRVIAMWQNSIETLLDLGQGDKIIAACGLPDKKYLRPDLQAAYDKIPYHDFHLYDQETAVMAEPDFILGWSSTFAPKVLGTAAFWHSRGVHTYAAASTYSQKTAKTLEQEYQYILDLGTIFNVQSRAQTIVQAMQAELAKLQAVRQGKPPVRALIIEFMGHNLVTYGDKTLAGDIARQAGAELVPVEHNLGREDLLQADPDVLFIVLVEQNYGQAQAYIDKIQNNTALRELKCVRNKRIYTLPLYAIYASGTRTMDGIRTIGRGLYPEVYKEMP